MFLNYNDSEQCFIFQFTIIYGLNIYPVSNYNKSHNECSEEKQIFSGMPLTLNGCGHLAGSTESGITFSQIAYFQIEHSRNADHSFSSWKEKMLEYKVIVLCSGDLGSNCKICIQYICW